MTEIEINLKQDCTAEVEVAGLGCTEMNRSAFVKSLKGKKLVVVDLDGTVAISQGRDKLIQECDPPKWDEYFLRCGEDKPNEPVVTMIKQLIMSGHYKFMFCTGRSTICQEETVKWIYDTFETEIEEYDFTPYLKMREQGDHRHDSEVKPELLSKMGVTPDDVAFILEDRNSMVKKWRELGFTVFQVAETTY